MQIWNYMEIRAHLILSNSFHIVAGTQEEVACDSCRFATVSSALFSKNFNYRQKRFRVPILGAYCEHAYSKMYTHAKFLRCRR